MAKAVSGLTKQSIALQIAADKAARAAKSKAKRDAKKALVDAAAKAEHDRINDEAAARMASRDLGAEKLAYRKSLAIDFVASNEGVDFPDLDAGGAWHEQFEAYIADNTAPVADGKVREQKYFGPMLALREAQARYIKPANGILCNGDELAMLLGDLKREDVVRVLIKAMKLEGNPYLHLNPGQQSMNLRNKARQQIKNGFLTLAAVKAAK